MNEERLSINRGKDKDCVSAGGREETCEWGTEATHSSTPLTVVKQERGAKKTERQHEDWRWSGRNKCLCLAQHQTMRMGWLRHGFGFYLYA